jgi:translation initiation factor 3 subunit B
MFWSPAGKNIVLAGLKSMNGQLEFFNVRLASGRRGC